MTKPHVASATVVTALLVFCLPAAAKQWYLENDENPGISYRDADGGTAISITCGGEGDNSANASELLIPVPSGIKPPARAPEVRIKEKTGVRTMKLQWDVCGGELTPAFPHIPATTSKRHERADLFAANDEVQVIPLCDSSQEFKIGRHGVIEIALEFECHFGFIRAQGREILTHIHCLKRSA